jgi:MFS family permease
LLAFGLLAAAWWYQPVWQVHDDSIYAMIAQGYGVVAAPSAEVPFMHPMIGLWAARVAHLTGFPGYATVLYALTLVGASTLAAALWRAEVSPLGWALAAVAILPMVLTPQYTMTAGLLGAAGMAALAMALRASRPRPSWAALTVGCWVLAALFRVEMLLMVVMVASPWLIGVVRRVSRTGITGRQWIGGVSAAALLALLALVVPASADRMRSAELTAMLEAHAARVPFVDYGRQSLLQYPQMEGRAGLRPVEIELLGSWFFADPILFTRERLEKAEAAIPAAMRYRWGGTALLKQLAVLPRQGFFWLALALVPLALLSSPRWPVLAMLGLGVMANVVLALLGRPFPERVGLGLVAGLVILALVHASAFPAALSRGVRLATWLVISALGIASLTAMRPAFELPPDQDVAKVRRHLEDRTGELVYFTSPALPLRALFRPGEVPTWLMPHLVSLSTLSEHPAARAFERASPCGPFMTCLSSGGRVSVYATDGFVTLLDRYLQEQYGRRIEVVQRSEVAKWRHYVLTTVAASAAPR